MKSVEEYADEYRSIVQEHVLGQEVLAVGVLSRPGSLGSALLSMVSPLAAILKNKKGKSASAGLPQNVIAAVTPTRVMFFDFRPKMASIKVKDRVLDIARHGLTVTVEEHNLAARLTFHLAEGSSFELDSNRSVGQYQRLNADLLHHLGATS